MAHIRSLVAGNWKMNGHRSSIADIEAIAKVAAAGNAGMAELLICPPATLIMAASQVCIDTPLLIGAQDCHVTTHGAYTGNLSAPMLKDAGASYVIVGHSERRADHDESNALVCAKATAALDAGLNVILCVGETLELREKGHAEDFVGQQLAQSLPEKSHPASLVVAYEPVWAIGTGLIPSFEDIASMHAFMHDRLEQFFGRNTNAFRFLYGGSVKPSNAPDIMNIPHVNGTLVGGASLNPQDFLAIARACL